MEFNPARMCELLVGLPDVNVLAVDDRRDLPIVVHRGSLGGAVVPGVRCPGNGQGTSGGGPR